MRLTTFHQMIHFLMFQNFSILLLNLLCSFPMVLFAAGRCPLPPRRAASRSSPWPRPRQRGAAAPSRWSRCRPTTARGRGPSPPPAAGSTGRPRPSPPRTRRRTTRGPPPPSSRGYKTIDEVRACVRVREERRTLGCLGPGLGLQLPSPVCVCATQETSQP